MNGDPVDPDQDIEVEPLPEPQPPPFGADELAEPGPAEQLGADQAIARILEPAIGAPFYLAGLWLGRGLPDQARRTVRLAWRVNHDELGPIADALAPMIPADFLASNAARFTPGLAAVVMLAALVEERATATAEIRRQHTEGAPTDDRSDRSDPAPSARAGRRRAGAAADRQPAGESAPPGGSAFEGAGLGLVGDEPGGAPAGPPERP